MTELVNGIVAIGSQGQIGLNGGIPWITDDYEGVVKDDLAWFAKLTAGGVLIVGYKTFEEMKALGFKNKDRAIEIWTGRDQGPGGFLGTVRRRNGDRPIWICGGGKTFDAFAFFINRWHISTIPYPGPADVYFDNQWLFGRKTHDRP